MFVYNTVSRWTKEPSATNLSSKRLIATLFNVGKLIVSKYVAELINY